MLFISYRYVEGGMGSVSKAIGNAATEAGAHIVTNAEVCHQESLLTLKLASFIVSKAKILTL